MTALIGLVSAAALAMMLAFPLHGGDTRVSRAVDRLAARVRPSLADAVRVAGLAAAAIAGLLIFAVLGAAVGRAVSPDLPPTASTTLETTR